MTPTDYAGYRAHTWARSIGTLVVLVDAIEQGVADPPTATAWDDAGRPIAWDRPDRWALICEGRPGGPTHASICTWPTLKAARSFMSAPEQWCCWCQTGEDAPNDRPPMKGHP